jgi:hypothetical protein
VNEKDLPMKRTASILAAVVMMVAMASFLALTPASYVMQARLNGYRYHEWLGACRDAGASGGSSYREGYVYDDAGRLASVVAGKKVGKIAIVLSKPMWNVYRYQASGVSDCDNGDGLYLAKKIGLAVPEK